MVAGHALVAGDADVGLVGLNGKVLSDRARAVADERVGRLEVRVRPEQRREQVVERALGERGDDDQYSGPVLLTTRKETYS